MKHEVETKVWLTNPEDAGTPEARYTTYGYDMTEQGWFLVGAFEVPFTPPTREEVIPSVVVAMKAVIQTKRAECELACRSIEEGIEKLLALTYEPRGTE